MATTNSATRQLETRTLHFDLSHARAGAEHTLHLGVRRYALKPHTDATRTQFRAQRRMLSHIPDPRLTHYLEDIEFPADAVQSFYITHPHERPGGLPRLSLMAIHVPQPALGRLTMTVHEPGALYASKARRLGLSLTAAGPTQATPQDLADYVDMTEAAKNIVFHHPELISLGPDKAATTLGYIENTSAFDALCESLGEQGQAQHPDSDYEGWANGEYIQDLDGNQISYTKPDGTTGYRWKYVYTQQTLDAMRPVVQQALLKVRDDKDMEGISFATQYGMHNVPNTPPPAQPALAARAAVRAAAQQENSPYTYKLDDPDWNSGRKVVINEIDGRDLKITVNNNFFRYLGVFARYLKYDNTGTTLVPIKLADLNGGYTKHPLDGVYVNFLGKVDDRPRLMGIPIKDQEEAEFEITLPEAANAIDIFCGGLGTGAPNREATENADVPGAVLTGVLNLGIPAFFLLFGVSTLKIESEGKKLIVDLAGWIVDTFVGLIARASMQGAHFSQDNMPTSWAMDILDSLIKEAPPFFADLLAWAAAASAEEAAESSIPVVGQVLMALGVTATLVEIAVTVADICLSPPVIPAQITSTLDIKVTIKPDPDDYQFPASATKYKLVAHLTDTMKWDSGWLDFHVSDFDPQNDKFPTYTFTDIPAGGEVEVTVQFVSDTEWVAAYGTTGKVKNIVEEGSDALDLDIVITENPVPLTTSTLYRHQRKLGLRDGGSHYWIETSDGKGPSQTKADLGGNASVSLEDLTSAQITFNMHKDQTGKFNVAVLGYSWQGKSPTLNVCGAGGGASTPLYTMQSVELGTASPDQLLSVLNCGVSAPLLVTYDLIGPATTDATGGNFVVALTEDGPNAQHYHARKLDLSGSGDIDLTKMPSWGRFTSPKIGSIAAHGAEFLLALSPDLEMIEILRLPKQPYAQDSDAQYATQIGKPGSYVGRLHGSRAMALTRDGNTFLVLEETNNRIQAFNTNGQVVKYFAGQSEIPLRQWEEDQAKQITYLDMNLEYGGYLYVLSYEGAGDKPELYRLDIYDPSGQKLARTIGVSAARLAVDQWRAVYTLNFELLIGRNQRPEPSVSLWATSG
jgi:hypothetical protein